MGKPKQDKQHKKVLRESSLEKSFRSIWGIVAADLPLEAQKENIVTGRQYVYDFFVPSADVLIECNGGEWMRGNSGHSSGQGIQRDADKVNQAQRYGYNIFVITKEKLTVEYIGWIANFCRENAL